jgi:hypothetical protein
VVKRRHHLSPQDFLHFVELDEFCDDWANLGLNDGDLLALQMLIMSSPKSAPVIEGTGGLRKVRFAPGGWKSGKSGGVRVCYAYFEKHWTVLLVMAYGKRQKETLTSHEKASIKGYLARVEKWLEERNA